MSSVNHKRMLTAISKFSREFGTDEYVVAGGGNSSCKNSKTLWVKPSGTRLADMTEDSFVALDREKLAELYDFEVPADPHQREKAVTAIVKSSVLPDSSGRPSVEAPLHDSMAYRYVLHVHPALVNGLTCAMEGENACRRLFPELLWIPYIDPGYTLCMQVRESIAQYSRTRGVQPANILLQNHGVFVGGDSLDDIRSRYTSLAQGLEKAYAEAEVPTRLPLKNLGATPGCQKVAAAWKAASPEAPPPVVQAAEPMPVPEGPLTPDHIVYAKAYPLAGEATPERLAEFRREHGYAPKVVFTENAVYAIGASETEAEMILKTVHNGARIQQLAKAFGGVRFMDERSTAFIENWEAESYRRQVNA